MASITPTSRVSIFWEPPSQLVQGALDYILAGSLVSVEIPDTNVDRYELELFNTKIDQYVNQGYFYKPQADITVADSVNVKIRIRALLRDETKTPWVESGTLILSTTQFDFAEPDNSILLGFV